MIIQTFPVDPFFSTSPHIETQLSKSRRKQTSLNFMLCWIINYSHVCTGCEIKQERDYNNLCMYSCINTLHSNISKYILHTVLYTHPKVLKRRFFFKSRVSLVGDHFLSSHDCAIHGWYCKEKLDAIVATFMESKGWCTLIW